MLSKSSTPFSTEQATKAPDKLMSIITSQNFDGSWPAAAVAELGIAAGSVKPAEITDDAWATAVIVSFL
jgi:hypothetical protein